MPRRPRIHVPGGFHHATLRGNHRQDIFRHDGDRVLLNRIVARAIDKHQVRVHAFCWMSNHLHFLVQVGETPLGRLMQQVASEYARAFQRRLETTGHLFENRYYATFVDTDAYLLEALRYVHQNPVRAQIVPRAALYRWSSHAAYVAAGGEPWVTTSYALALFSADPARAAVLYRAFVDATPAGAIAEELATLETGAAVLGRRDRSDAGAAVATRHDTTLSPQGPSLDDIIAGACRHFGVTPSEVRSPQRTARLVAARAWIAQTAVRNGVATITAIARALNRDESTLRYAMKRYAVEQSSQALETGAENSP